MADLDKLMDQARDWNSRRGQLSGSLASLRKYDAEGAQLLRKLTAALDAARGEAVVRGRIDEFGELVPATVYFPTPQAPPAAPRVERYGDGVLVHWAEGVEQYVCVGDCVTGNLGSLAVPADNVAPMRQPRADLARLVESINAAVYANGNGLSVTEAIGALELAKLELLKEQEQ